VSNKTLSYARLRQYYHVSGKLTPYKMNKLLQAILILEDNESFDEAFEAYNTLYNDDKSDYAIWKHFYFFLWTAIEDAPSSFHERINLRHLLQVMFQQGKRAFADIADFNFIAGYTVSIFPYEYGDYEDLEKEGRDMLLRAAKLEPDNAIYKLAYLGGTSDVDPREYAQAATEAGPKVLETFAGGGALNKYCREIFYRLDKTAYR
jgi:hypothetical protein